ncbi:flagellar export chaperone FliS [Microbacterium hydrocarbonoxydans]|uniref:Flagellar secretion chaperone FliS n=1 Tax=Microbacterium hydrocarbonoxydans TaxID=273678 RepID=A0A1H4LJT3_9MICO|nr:flagellar export chaperone FliS [Microbacterium hydrocarbonoxydans]SEB70970.1 flagellar protein FliS [Microbacterium hydrocarbonoxydans]
MALTSLDRAKQQYLEQQVASATPERLLTLLYDRLLVDIDRAASAQDAEDWPAAGTHLTHAQWIVSELNGSLTDVWDGAAELRGVYTYLTGRLITANISRDRAATAECRDLVAPLREAWHEAAAITTAAAPQRSALG